NDLNKIIGLVKMENEELWNSKKIIDSFNITTERQVSYYLTAMMYLDIIDSNRKFTDFGLKLHNSNESYLKILLAMKIVSKPIFGDFLFEKYLFNRSFKLDDIAQSLLITKTVDSEAVAIRRASTVKAW